jgi:MFS family permease
MDVRHKRLLLHVWIVCALGLFIDGYDLYISSVAEPFINALYHPSPFMIGLIQAAAPIGAAFGALFIGRVADKIGRKNLSISTLFINSFVVLGACSAIFVIAKMNPFKLQKIGFIVSFFGLLILSFNNIPSNGFLTLMVFSGFIFFNFFVNFGSGITTYLLPAELYPTEIKATGHGVAASCGKMGSALGSLCLPILQFYFGIYFTVGVLAMALLIGW